MKANLGPEGDLASGSCRTFRDKARAKVNLTLHVKGKRPDGYHELESLVVFADLCDELTFTEGSAQDLIIDGPFANAVDGENLVSKAKQAVSSWLNKRICGCFRINKNIPVAAGLGGGSADAAAAIRLLLAAYGSPLEHSEFTTKALAIGADVPVCLHNGPAIMRGLGERLTPVQNVAALPAVLVNPQVKLATAAVFKMLSAPPYKAPLAGSDEPVFPGWKNPEDAALLLREGRNDLEAPAMKLEPAVKAVLNAIAESGNCLLARLSGSGATCFGIFKTHEAAAAAAEAIASEHADWWVVPTVLS